jgi:hypothetical protein
MMVRKPPGHSWLGFTEEQGRLLDQLDFYGNNGWARNPQGEALMPKLMGDLSGAGLDLDIRQRQGSHGIDRLRQGRAARTRPLGIEAQYREVRALSAATGCSAAAYQRSVYSGTSDDHDDCETPPLADSVCMQST